MKTCNEEISFTRTNTFIGCDGDYENSDIVIFGAPYDGTTSNRPGTRFAGKAIRSESFGIETFSPYQNKDLTDIRVFDGGELNLPFGDPAPVLEIISKYTQKILSDKKIPVMIGGEHLVTLGAFRAVYRRFPEVNIIHFDAHADLRDEYLGAKLSHACVLRRCWELIGDNKIFQFGIRSGDRDEFSWGEKHVFIRKFDFDGISEIVRNLKIKNKPVYLTVDLDVLDSAVFPATGTPEAGGVSFNELISAIKTVSDLNIVGADLNELSPPYDQTGVSTALACKVLRELLLYI